MIGLAHRHFRRLRAAYAVFPVSGPTSARCLLSTDQRHNTLRVEATSNAFEVVSSGKAVQPSILLTAEHASNAMPEGWDWKGNDIRLKEMHWGLDIGSSQWVDEFCQVYSTRGIKSKVSRVLIDMNRPRDSDTLIRTHADSIPIKVNTDVSRDDIAMRMALYDEYHSQLDALVAEGVESGLELLLSVHSFTPEYEGQKRHLEFGVLTTDLDDKLAEKMVKLFNDEGIASGLNKPWSGLEGFMHSADFHARKAGLRAVMLELRQDLILDPAWRLKTVRLVHDALVEDGVIAA